MAEFRVTADRGRRLPVGAEEVPGGVHFRVWAPRRERVAVVIDNRGASRPFAIEEGGETDLLAEGNGYFSGLAEGLAAGALYRYRLDGGALFADPASRFQPEGPHGPSQVIDP